MNNRHAIAINDLYRGFLHFDMWGRLGWLDVKRRYHRTVIGPFWTTLSLGIFVGTIGVLYSTLWQVDLKYYLPYLCSGMIPWVLLSGIVTDGCLSFVGSTIIITQMKTHLSSFIYAIIWKNILVFFHNILIFIPIAIYSGVELTPATLLLIPGVILIAINSGWVVLILGILCTRYRDIQQVVTSLVQVLLFVTPIFWLPELLNGRWTLAVDVNFLYHLISIIRAPMMGEAASLFSYMYVSISAIIGWGVAYFIFAKFRSRIPFWL